MATKKSETVYGSICHPAGRTLEVTSKHSEWLDWATRALYAYQGIKDALGTDEDGDALIEVARNAHRAEQELAALKRNPDDEPPPPDVNYDCDPIADQRMDASDFERDKPSHA